MTRKFFIILTFLFSLSPLAMAQESKLINQLKGERGALQKQIRETESLLKNTQKTVASQLNHLSVLTGQIAERKRYIRLINNDVSQLERELGRLESQLKVLNSELDSKKANYAKSVQYLRHHHNFEDKLMFVLSAENFSQSIRRMRYVQQYASYQQLQGHDLLRQREQVTHKQQELQKVRQEKQHLLEEREAEKQKLEQEENKRRGVVSGLQKRQRTLQTTIRQKKKEADKLNAKIDQLINEEIERARIAAEKAAAEKKAAAARKAAGEKQASSGKTAVSSNPPSPSTVEKKPLEVYTPDKDDIKLSGHFADNYGKLPMPITGSYIVVSHYGKYAVDGLRNVTLDNKGMDIQGKPGAQARAVFTGKVVAIFQLNGLFNILVRHGSYISVYCNLISTDVENGQAVSTKQPLGRIFTDKADNDRTVLHFQLRKEKVKLNPERWLRQ